MLKWTVILGVLACLAAVCGFSSLAAGFAGVARIAFFLFLLGFSASLLVRRARRRRLASASTQRLP
jgi:uncharacterized membrane protein YtjA (UPF0391 family)